MKELLMRITGPNFVAGIVWQKTIDNYDTFRLVSMTYNKIVACAPHVQHVAHKNWTPEFTKSFFKKCGHKVELMEVHYDE